MTASVSCGWFSAAKTPAVAAPLADGVGALSAAQFAFPPRTENGPRVLTVPAPWKNALVTNPVAVPLTTGRVWTEPRALTHVPPGQSASVLQGLPAFEPPTHPSGSSSEQVLPGQSASLPQAFPTFTPATQLEQNFLSAPYGKVPEPGVGATLTLQTFGLAPLGGVTVPIAVLLRMIVDPGPPGLHV